MNTATAEENKKAPKPPSPHLLRGCCLLILSERSLETTVLVYVHFGKSSCSHMNWTNMHVKTILVIMDLITGLGVCKTHFFGKAKLTLLTWYPSTKLPLGPCAGCMCVANSALQVLDVWLFFTQKLPGASHGSLGLLRKFFQITKTI